MYPSFHWTFLEKLKKKALYWAVFIRLSACHPGCAPKPSDCYLCFNFALQTLIKNLEEFSVSLKLNIKSNGHFSCGTKCVSTCISRVTRQVFQKNRTGVLEKYEMYFILSTVFLVSFVYPHTSLLHQKVKNWYHTPLINVQKYKP